MDSMGGFELANNLANGILAECIDYSTIYAKFVDPSTLHANTFYTFQF